MNIVISHISALQFWRARLEIEPPVLVRLREIPSQRPELTPETLRLLESRGIDTSEVHLLVSKSGARSQSKSIATHLWTSYSGSKLFFRLGDDVYVCGPELCFLQMAATLSFAELVMYGCELCGRYRKRGIANDSINLDFGTKLIFPEPITSIHRLAAVCESCQCRAGKRQARKALPYVFENSYSPRETVTALLLSLPRNYGGEGLPRPVLNQEVLPAKSSSTGLGGLALKCDLFWPERSVGVEYDSDAHHSADDAISVDSQRRTAFANRGIAITTMTNNEIKDPTLFDEKVVELRRALGCPARKDEYAWRERRSALRKELLHRRNAGIV